eukprot:CAMPEP_0116133342 /NCGR_PEP_ID=MMETSP0329-20121206/10052_1 /TAXON_ID=697910 /ORGANISM="Pseudo-nitzschia arenysensis, Strain B593" /LENGTH=218 /DNA_ID=CAMNT_0003627961 /DNA_START=237 /DNA_END=893 /DNA_ORIENTATION=+
MNQRTQQHQQQPQFCSSATIGNPSTPSRSQTTSSRPLPPWPVSPASPESPKARNSPVCPGAPIKKRFPRRRFANDDDDVGGETSYAPTMFQRGFRPRRLDFGDVSDETGNNDDKDTYPILRAEIASTPQHNTPSSPLLGFRPSSQRRKKGANPSLDVVPRNSAISSSTSTPDRPLHLQRTSLQRGVSNESSDHRSGDIRRTPGIIVSRDSSIRESGSD